MTTHPSRRRAYPDLAFKVIASGCRIDKAGHIVRFREEKETFPFTVPGLKKARAAALFEDFGEQGQSAPRSYGTAHVIRDGAPVTLGYALDGEAMRSILTADAADYMVDKSRTAQLAELARMAYAWAAADEQR